jgi:uncharacterized protein (TIGR02001 family)
MIAALLRAALPCALLMFTQGACAQLSGNLTLASDYRFRGVSLSREDPALQGALAYDDSSGWYAGALVSNVQFALESSRNTQLVSYFGYALRLDARWSVEAGATYASFNHDSFYDYPEAYAGVAFDKISGRIYYSPRYFGLDVPARYAEINASQPLGEHWQLLAHVGALRYENPYAYPEEGPRTRWDARIGVGTEWESYGLQLSWVGHTPYSFAYPSGAEKHRNNLVLTLSRSF